MQHIEFFHTDHFENNYYRVAPPPALAQFIDFFWETKFDRLWKQYPKGFSDAQFPNTGYTFIINLGTPFVMQVGEEKFSRRTDCFLPRYNAIECFHSPGNHLFGIKFRISPVLFQKKVNFSEYRDFIFPLSYLLDPSLIEQVKKARNFGKRVEILSANFQAMLAKNAAARQDIAIVSSTLDRCFRENDFSPSLEKLADDHGISSRTLQRYFEICTGITPKQALQVMRIRKAVAHIARSPGDFHYAKYGYYDHSHFYKHLRQFMGNNTLKNLQPHLAILELINAK